MLLLARRAPRAPPLQRHGPPVAVVGDCIEVQLGGVIVAALPGGALWIEAGRALVVADLHLEKGSAFAKRGQMLPPYDTRETLTRLQALIDEHEPDIVASLGDAFHDGGGVWRMGAEDRATLKRLTARCDWVWVEGNHDGGAAELMGGVARRELDLGVLSLRHEPTGAPNEIAGHLHPCAKVGGAARSVRRRCFATDGERMVLPAFGAFTGGLNVCDPAFASIFPSGVTALVLAKDRVLPTAASRLLAD
jgi:DNA ligase-associated metallophosphoesterase